MTSLAVAPVAGRFARQASGSFSFFPPDGGFFASLRCFLREQPGCFFCWRLVLCIPTHPSDLSDTSDLSDCEYSSTPVCGASWRAIRLVLLLAIGTSHTSSPVRLVRLVWLVRPRGLQSTPGFYPWFSLIFPENPQIFQKISKLRLQSSETMIYYVSVARRKRRCSEADITLKILRIMKFWNFRFWKKSKKFQKTICKTKNLWYIMFLSLAKCERADWKLNSAM